MSGVMRVLKDQPSTVIRNGNLVIATLRVKASSMAWLGHLERKGGEMKGEVKDKVVLISGGGSGMELRLDVRGTYLNSLMYREG